MSFRAQIQEWLRKSGKVWLFRALIIVAMSAIALSAIPYFARWALSTNAILLLMLGLLLLFMEIFLDSISSVERDRGEGTLYDWHNAVLQIREEADKAKKIVVVACSGEMAYHALSDILIEKGNKISTEVYLVLVQGDEHEAENYLTHWKKSWLELGDCISGIKIVRTPICLRLAAIILDDQIGYLTCVQRTASAFRNELSLRVTSRTQEGAFLINLFLNWINQHALLTEQKTRE